MSVRIWEADTSEHKVGLWEDLVEDVHEWDGSTEANVERLLAVEYFGCGFVELILKSSWKIWGVETISAIEEIELDLGTEGLWTSSSELLTECIHNKCV